MMTRITNNMTARLTNSIEQGNVSRVTNFMTKHLPAIVSNIDMARVTNSVAATARVTKIITAYLTNSSALRLESQISISEKSNDTDIFS